MHSRETYFRLDLDNVAGEISEFRETGEAVTQKVNFAHISYYADRVHRQVRLGSAF